MLVGVQVSVSGLYLAPVLKKLVLSSPPHTIISVSLDTALCDSLAVGAPVMAVGAQLSEPGLYLPPVLRTLPLLSSPPHTIISPPTKTAV